MKSRTFLAMALVWGGLGLGLTTPAYAASAQLSDLADVAFGTIISPVDQTKSANVSVCSFQNKPHATSYSVTAIGSGPGGSFELSNGVSGLTYDVQWSDSIGQTGGTMLQAGAAAPAFGNAADGFDCSGHPDNASLTVTIRSASLASAMAGSYSGTLQITIAPE
jgi:hypothetical protein